MVLVELENIETGGRQSFRFDVVPNLFKLEAQIKQQCWRLPKDSDYTYQDGKLIRKSGDTPNQNAEKRAGNSKGAGKKTSA